MNYIEELPPLGMFMEWFPILDEMKVVISGELSPHKCPIVNITFMPINLSCQAIIDTGSYASHINAEVLEALGSPTTNISLKAIIQT